MNLSHGSVCSNGDCDTTISSDATAVLVNQSNVFCNGPCAVKFIAEANEEPYAVGIHDPGFHINRDQFGAPVDEVNLGCPVEDRQDALGALIFIIQFHPDTSELKRGWDGSPIDISR